VGVGEWERGQEGKGRGGRKRGKMTQTLYAHMNKRKNKLKKGETWKPPLPLPGLCT
jgi:hypothetical protein